MARQTVDRTRGEKVWKRAGTFLTKRMRGRQQRSRSRFWSCRSSGSSGLPRSGRLPRPGSGTSRKRTNGLPSLRVKRSWNGKGEPVSAWCRETGSSCQPAGGTGSAGRHRAGRRSGWRCSLRIPGPWRPAPSPGGKARGFPRASARKVPRGSIKNSRGLPGMRGPRSR